MENLESNVFNVPMLDANSLVDSNGKEFDEEGYLAWFRKTYLSENSEGEPKLIAAIQHHNLKGRQSMEIKPGLYDYTDDSFMEKFMNEKYFISCFNMHFKNFKIKFKEKDCKYVISW